MKNKRIETKKNQSKYIFDSKANVLKSIKKSIKKSEIEFIYDFKVSDWQKDKKKILTKIQKLFSSKIIIRSSAIGEDSVEKSEAGKYLSVLNINSKSKTSIKNGIEDVIKSYMKTSNFLNNQILIQTQTKNVLVSGVVFTKTLESGSPYYVINFEDGSSTDSVTKGIISNTIKINNKIKKNQIPLKWKRLIFAIQEIEKITNCEELDIEFAITKNGIKIFQVRPLTTTKNKSKLNKNLHINSEIKKNQKKFLKLKSKKSKINKKIIFSNMVDWNPAEIIGNKPKIFDYSLYDSLIMKKTWSQGRKLLGYNLPENSCLMTEFSGQPYVNVKTSFSSFFPSKMSKKIQRKLMNYYMKKLESNPHLHDKVEFDILFSCYDFSFKERSIELKDFGFTNNEIDYIKNILLEFTNEIIRKTPDILSETQSSIKKLNKKRLDSKLKVKNYTEKLKNAELLLNYCKKYGAIRFSAVARLAFISAILLKGLYETCNIKKEKIDKFLNSISSPLSEFQTDLYNLKNKKTTKTIFLKKYGHLRPGTYDITVSRYDHIPEFLDNLMLMDIKKPTKINESINYSQIEKVIKKNGLNFNQLEFFEFVRKTISSREKIKFEFTKSLSDLIELIADAGEILGFSREELSYLAIDDILKYKIMKEKQLKKFWKNKIQKNKHYQQVVEQIQLPPIIFSKNDFQIIEHYIAKPNYITNKKITSNSLFVNNLKNISSIESKIVIIENADPGFDWIFSNKPSGLITKFGGIASHMAIRCAELGLPAAIGCGEILFDKLKISSKITLDCKNNDILILEYKQKNDFSEEKKLLKSLGYIK
tara:strand:+ start:1847 stop:4297 length:2451 start_codon:yes stop_codon:yes gene_type:complete